MDYCVSFRIKTDGKWITVGEKHCIPWNMRDLITASSGWTVINDNAVGNADKLAYELQKGILELTNSPGEYLSFEVRHGIGTIGKVLAFYRELLDDCRKYPFTNVYGKIA